MKILRPMLKKFHFFHLNLGQRASDRQSLVEKLTRNGKAWTANGTTITNHQYLPPCRKAGERWEHVSSAPDHRIAFQAELYLKFSIRYCWDKPLLVWEFILLYWAIFIHLLHDRSYILTEAIWQCQILTLHCFSGLLPWQPWPMTLLRFPLQAASDSVIVSCLWIVSQPLLVVPLVIPQPTSSWRRKLFGFW